MVLADSVTHLAIEAVCNLPVNEGRVGVEW